MPSFVIVVDILILQRKFKFLQAISFASALKVLLESKNLGNITEIVLYNILEALVENCDI